MDESSREQLERYRQEYRDNDEATRWAMQRMQLNHLEQKIEKVARSASDALTAATLAGNIAKGSIEAAERRLRERIDSLAEVVGVANEEAKTIALGVNELRQNVGGVLELAESAVTMAGSAQRTVSKLAIKNDETARNQGASSQGSGPASAG